jgi:hypothetical protein
MTARESVKRRFIDHSLDTAQCAMRKLSGPGIITQPNVHPTKRPGRPKVSGLSEA